MKDAEPIEVQVFRSPRRADTYIFLEAEADFSTLPEVLREQFGEGEAFLRFELSASRYLAQADAGVVMEAIRTKGFYLQLPPRDDEFET